MSWPEIVFICIAQVKKANIFFKIFAVTNHHFVEPLVISALDFWLILPMGFKARVDPSSPTLCSRLRVMIFRVNSEKRPIIKLV